MRFAVSPHDRRHQTSNNSVIPRVLRLLRLRYAYPVTPKPSHTSRSQGRYACYAKNPKSFFVECRDRGLPPSVPAQDPLNAETI